MKENSFLKKIVLIQSVVILALLIIIIVILLNCDFKTKSSEKTNVNNAQINNMYDVSSMNSVNLNGLMNIFKSGKLSFAFVGRSTCGVCQNMLPLLKSSQQKYDFTINYLDLTTIDSNSSEWKDFINFLDIKTDVTVKEEGKLKVLNNTYGYFLETYGFTPTFIIAKDGKMISGHIGAMDEEELYKWLENNGFIK